MTAAVSAVEWPVWSTTARVVVTDSAASASARALVRAHLAEVDAACSRFRADSEVSRLARADGKPVHVSALLAEHVRAALSAARDTGGDVDPTVGAAMIGLGYDRDFGLLLPARSGREARESDARTRVEAADVAFGTGETAAAPQADGATSDSPALVAGTGVAAEVAGGWSAVPESRRSETRVAIAARVDWTAVSLEGQLLCVPAGVLLDLGATAKALAADVCAHRVAARLGCGVLVSLGGDIATAGAAPDGGWQVLVEDRPGEPRSRVALPAGAGLATSSTLRRRWWRGGSVVHHIVDPRTGVAADPEWRTVSVAASSCLAANTAATAAIVRGRDALTGLRAGGLPARLVRRDGAVVVLGGWPESDLAAEDKREFDSI
ncbi:FAD:protein FMN transferase [Nocardia sp. ET3-3]|uniref:FAD:protein FMN transferase n=1 Tax=Nocardia terrae TaxID=2675851 RepID=A0A7K1V786_9NOCA|nr:FAD:protein FMN transferase [Nocardia terrae]MVU82510.1 FAD:protein FMN transferase [Nocardia terrae]